jgi:hypothetical protein
MSVLGALPAIFQTNDRMDSGSRLDVALHKYSDEKLVFGAKSDRRTKRG